jgi:hypothetical protein
MANLEVNFCGVEIKNPVVASSAEPTLNARNMKKCIDAGAGGVITKTMTDSPAMRELTTRSKWRFLNEKHEVCRGKVPRAFSLYGRSGLALEEPEVFVKGGQGNAAVRRRPWRDRDREHRFNGNSGLGGAGQTNAGYGGSAHGTQFWVSSSQIDARCQDRDECGAGLRLCLRDHPRLWPTR